MLCTCDSPSSIRITSELGGDSPADYRFRARCDDCGGKKPHHSMPVEKVRSVLPNPDDTDADRVTVTLSSPLDDETTLEVAVEAWDNPFRKLSRLASA